MEYLIIIIGFVFFGAFAGIMSGLLGIGGGLVIVPGLAYIYQFTPVPHDYLMQMAEGTSLAIMIPTTIRALYAHLRHQVSVWPVYPYGGISDYRRHSRRFFGAYRQFQSIANIIRIFCIIYGVSIMV